MELFNAAASFAAKQLGKYAEPTEAQQLELYGLYKQATVGVCNTKKPWAWNFTDCAKWNAWKASEKIGKEEAMEKYINIVESLCPEWQSHMNVEGNSDSGSLSTAAVFSRPIYEDQKISESELTICDYVSDNNIAIVKKILDADSTLVNYADQEKRTPLHFACDRGLLDIAKLLIEKYSANVNAKDGDDQTPLHYAVLCEEVELVKLLLSHNADATVQNVDNQTPADLIEDNSVLKSLF